LVCSIFCVWPLLVGALPTFLIMKYRPRIRFTLDRDGEDSLEGYARPVAQAPRPVINPNAPRRPNS
jgi:hypothetical protein